jgi:hypothetical protein
MSDVSRLFNIFASNFLQMKATDRAYALVAFQAKALFGLYLTRLTNSVFVLSQFIELAL